MKVKFSWDDSAGSIVPVCTSQVVNRDGISLLSCLLMDDGGVPYLQSISWIEEGLKKTENVMKAEMEDACWDRESWGVIICFDRARIYSLNDEDYFDDISPRQLKGALASWRDFLKTTPKTGYYINMEL